MSRSVPLAKAMDDAIVALYQNGERIRPGNGYPMRLLLPGFEGNTNVKWLRRIKLTDGPIMTRDETAKYTISRVAPSHYQTVAAALLWTLEQGLGDEFTSEIRQAWVECYTTLATTMQHAVAA
jgi:DMSO/TMAO reductase YedYZ molybdopterin-dependent catalytic subunit